MLKELFNKIMIFFSRIIPSNKRQNANVVLVMDPMEPFEKAAIERRHAQWYDVELSDVTHGTIRYKI
jgi:hypothetical protein